MKKIKTGKVEVPDSSFEIDNALIRVSMMLPPNVVSELKRLSLTEEHGGKYQVLARDILKEWVENRKRTKRRA